jgi:hypothetical protein
MIIIEEIYVLSMFKGSLDAFLLCDKLSSLLLCCFFVLFIMLQMKYPSETAAERRKRKKRIQHVIEIDR